VSIVGAGRLGTALGLALRRAGHKIEVVATAHAATARNSANAIGSKTIPSTAVQLQDTRSEAHGRLLESDLVIIATPDTTIQNVANDLAQALPKRNHISRKPVRTVLHTSGAMSSELLAPLRGRGFAAGSLHPVVSVAEPESGAEVFRDVYFCVEGDASAVRIARMLVAQLGGRSFTIKPESKPLYHASAVMASGHVVALFDLAMTMLHECGLSTSEARRVLLPLLSSTADNLRNEPPSRALTGPYMRGDLTTVQKHLKSLRASKLAEANETYKVLARHAAALGKTLNQDKNLERIAELLEPENKR
jgi:predicted short-subunit dehydrogenase-like oxidoreductase (DUF2520 family)